MICNQVCPYNTLDGCEKDKYNADCPISNAVTQHDKSEWVSVKDRLPEHDETVIACYRFGDRILRFGPWDYYAHDPKPHWRNESTGVEVTHWMPIEPPREVE